MVPSPFVPRATQTALRLLRSMTSMVFGAVRRQTVAALRTSSTTRTRALQGVRCFSADNLRLQDDEPRLREELRDQGVDKLTISVAYGQESASATRERLDKRERLLKEKLTQNLPPQFVKLKGTFPEPKTTNNKGVLLLRGRERELYELHVSDPKVWNVKALAHRFRITRNRAQAVILLQKLHDDRLASGDYYKTDPEAETDLSTVRLDMSDYTYEKKDSDDAGADGAAAASEGDQADADGDSEGSGGAEAEAEADADEATDAVSKARAAKKKAARESASRLGLVLSPDDFEFFDAHGYFPSEVKTRPRTRIDGAGKGSTRYVLRDSESVEDVIKLADELAAVERKPLAPKAFPDKPTNVSCLASCFLLACSFAVRPSPLLRELAVPRDALNALACPRSHMAPLLELLFIVLFGLHVLTTALLFFCRS